MVQAAPEDPSRSSHQEILEEEQTQLDHVEDVLPRYRRIMEIVHACIDRGIFPDGSDVRYVLNAIMIEAHKVLIYRR